MTLTLNLEDHVHFAHGNHTFVKISNFFVHNIFTTCFGTKMLSTTVIIKIYKLSTHTKLTLGDIAIHKAMLYIFLHANNVVNYMGHWYVKYKKYFLKLSQLENDFKHLSLLVSAFLINSDFLSSPNF